MSSSYDNYFTGSPYNNGSVFGSQIQDNVEANSEKSKRKLWLALIAGVCVVVFVAVVFVISSSKKSHNETAPTEEQSLFNRFANYVLFGTDIDKDFSINRDFNKEPFLSEKFGDREVYKKAAELALNFSNSLESNNGAEYLNKASINIAKSWNGTLGFMEIVYPKEMLSMAKVIELYRERGREEMMKYVLDYYDFSNKDKNELLKDFSDFYEKWINSVFALINVYERYNCMNIGAIDEVCRERIRGTEDWENYINLVSAVRGGDKLMEDYYNGAYGVVSGLYMVGKDMKGEPYNDSGNEINNGKEEG